VGVAFNMPNIAGLKLSPSVLARIFSGTVTRWNDDAIAALNPDTPLPHSKIVPITAPDASALTLAATKYLNRSQDWTGGVSSTWTPTDGGIEVKKYRDVAKKVDETAGAIAFLDLDSISGRFDTALLSFSGEFIRQSKDSMAIAVREGRTNELSTGIEFVLPDSSNRGYPLGVVNYQAFCTSYPNQQLASLVTSWGKYVLSPEGQVTSAYFANSASPSETALQKSAILLDKIRAKN
jgi:phosphate transport system substrate-binding protein